MRTERKLSEMQTYMLYHPRVQVFPMFIIRKDFCFAQEWPKYIYNARPSHEFVSDEGLDQVTKKCELQYKLILQRTHCCISNFSKAGSANNRCIMSDCSLSCGARAT